MNLLKYTLAYRTKFNWSVMPISSTSKKPIIKWTKYQNQLPTIDEIKQWWTQYPDANIGLITGKISNVIVFDCDSVKANEWMEERGIERTLIAQSSKDYKKHYYFKYHKFDFNIGNKNLRHFNKIDLDIKCEGGYVVLPPSKHESGKRYKWLTPINTSIASMDIWQLMLLEKLFKPKEFNYTSPYQPKYGNEPAWVMQLLNGVQQGERDSAAFRLACFYAKRGFQQYEIETNLINWNLKCNPPLKIKEIKKCVKSGINKSLRG